MWKKSPIDPTPAATATRPARSAPTTAIVQLAASPSRRSPPRRKLLRNSAVASPSAIQPRTAIVAAFRCLRQWSARQARAPMGTSMYSLSLHAAHRPASGSAWPEGRSRGARGLIGRAGDELRPSRTQRFASAGPTSLRTAAQLERLADRSRASSAKLARIWSGSARLAPVRGRVSAGLVNAVSRSSGTASRSSRSDASMHPSEAASAGAECHELAAARTPCAASSSEQAWS